MTFTELSEAWLKEYKHNIKPGTYEHYCYVVRTIIQPNLGSINPHRINQKILDNFFITLQTRPRAKTNTVLCKGLIQKSYMLTRSIIEYGQQNGKCRKKFVPYFRKIKDSAESNLKIKFFEKEQYTQLINYCKTNRNFYTLAILLGIFQGLRIGEICGLKWEDIDLQHKRITINRTVRLSINPDTKKEEYLIGSPKSRSSQRTIPLNDYLYLYLSELKKTSNCNSYLIRNSKCNLSTPPQYPCSPRVLRNNYHKILKQLNLPKRTFHCLRHTFASTAIQQNIDPKTLSEVLGHADVKITLNLYVHSNEVQKRNCVNVFNEIMEEGTTI